MLLVMNDLGGVSARSTLQVGDTPGTSRIVVSVEEGKVITGSLSVNNHCSACATPSSARANAIFTDSFGLKPMRSLAFVTQESRCLTLVHGDPRCDNEIEPWAIPPWAVERGDGA